MSNEHFDVETVIRLHTEGACLEVGTDPDTGSAVEIRTAGTDSENYFGKVRLTLICIGDNKTFALAFSDAVRAVAEKLP